MAGDVVRVGPFGDRLVGRDRYLAFLARAVPSRPARYENDVHGVLASPDGRTACARVTERLAYPDRELQLEEAYWFWFDERASVTRVEIFWQTPEADPGGFGSATSEERDLAGSRPPKEPEEAS